MSLGLGLDLGSPTGTVEFLPTDITGLRAWYSAAVANVTKDGSDNVSQWNDSSGNGLHLTVPSGSNAPLWQDAQINGKPTITFDSGNSETLSRTVADFASGDSSGSIFAVITAQAAGSRIFCSADTATTTRFFILEQQDVSGQKMRTNQRNGGTTNTVRGSTNLSGDVALSWESDDTNYIFRVDGADETETTTSGGAGNWFAETSDRDNISIASLIRTTTAYSDVEIAELIIYGPQLSTANRTIVETYLSDKYATF